MHSNDLPFTTNSISRRFCCLRCSCAARRPFLGLRRCHLTASGSQLGHRPILRSARCAPSASFGAPRWRLTLCRPSGCLRCLPLCPAFPSARRCCCARVAPGGSSASHSARCCSCRQRLELAAKRAPVIYGRSSACSAAAASNRPLHSATQPRSHASLESHCSCRRAALLVVCCQCCRSAAGYDCVPSVVYCCSQRGPKLSCSDVTAESRIGHIRRRFCRFVILLVV